MKRDLENEIIYKNNIIKRQRLQIKRLQARNRRLEKKNCMMQEVNENLKNKSSMCSEDLHTLDKINLSVCFTQSQNQSRMECL